MAKRKIEELKGQDVIIQYNSEAEHDAFVELLNHRIGFIEDRKFPKGYISMATQFYLKDYEVKHCTDKHDYKLLPASDFLEGEILGYKVKEEFISAYCAVSGASSEAIYKGGCHFMNNSKVKNHLNKLKVLDLWCDPIYKEEKPRFEKGKWYINLNTKGTMLCYTGNGKGYGLWSNRWGQSWCIIIPKAYREATPEEVLKALEKYAREKYEGKTVECLHTKGYYMEIGKNCVFELRFDSYFVAQTDSKYLCIMTKGNWAEVKQQPELPVINNQKGKFKDQRCDDKESVFFKSQIVYGNDCAYLETSWFIPSNTRHIKSMTLNSGVTINEEQMEQIRDYLNWKEKN